MTPIIFLTVLSLLVIIIAARYPKPQKKFESIESLIMEDMAKKWRKTHEDLFIKSMNADPLGLCDLLPCPSLDTRKEPVTPPKMDIPACGGRFTQKDWEEGAKRAIPEDSFGKVKIYPKPLMGTLLRTANLPTNRLGLHKEAYVDVRRVSKDERDFGKCLIDPSSQMRFPCKLVGEAQSDLILPLDVRKKLTK